MNGNTIFLIPLISLTILFGSCQKTKEFSSETGIGPIKQKIEWGAVDTQKASQGERLFQAKCLSCHRIESSDKGPPLKGITKRRRPEWILNLMLNPVEMIQKDPAMQSLQDFYFTPMPFQNLTEDEAKALLEYLKQYDLRYTP